MNVYAITFRPGQAAGALGSGVFGGSLLPGALLQDAPRRARGGRC